MLRRVLARCADWKHAPSSMREKMPGDVHILGSSWSTQWLRNRLPLLNFTAQDPMMQEFLVRRAVIFAYDVPAYNYIFFAVFGAGFCAGILIRHLYFNPDVYHKRQELRKPYPDRVRQYSYSLPSYNSRARNYAAKWRSSLIDNEPDWIDRAPESAVRPERKQTHRRMPLLLLSIPRYFEQDPLYTSVSHESMGKMYREMGYSKQ
jgi:hypothetical protein